VGACPRILQFKLVEPPCAACSKMRCARLGRSLGLPEEIVRRHPFLAPAWRFRILA